MRLLALLPLALLTSCAPRAPDPRGVDHDETLLTVSATGRSETRPDEASVTVGVNSQGTTASEASTLNNQKMARVAAALARFGVKPDDMQTSNLSLARIDYGKERGRFNASNNVVIRLHDMARVGEAVAATTDAGANLVSGPALRVTDAEKASLSAYGAAYKAARVRAEAYAAGANLVSGPALRVTDAEKASLSAYGAAYKAARVRAEAYATAAGMKISRVLAIRDGGQSGGEPQPMLRTFDVQEAAAPPPVVAPPPPFNPGVNSSTVAVQVEFALSN